MENITFNIILKGRDNRETLTVSGLANGDLQFTSRYDDPDELKNCTVTTAIIEAPVGLKLQRLLALWSEQFP